MHYFPITILLLTFALRPLESFGKGLPGDSPESDSASPSLQTPLKTHPTTTEKSDRPQTGFHKLKKEDVNHVLAFLPEDEHKNLALTSKAGYEKYLNFVHAKLNEKFGDTFREDFQKHLASAVQEKGDRHRQVN